MNSRSTGTAYCKECNKKVGFHVEDWGIGAYEYWGARGTHHDYVTVCNECGEMVIDPEFDDREPEWEPDLNEDNWREDR